MSRSLQGRDLYTCIHEHNCTLRYFSPQCYMPGFIENGPPVRRVLPYHGLDGHLGHVTWIIYIHTGCPFLSMLYKNGVGSRPSGFSGEHV